MSKLRSINTVIWSDPWFELLEPSAKLLFIYFVTNEKTNMLGVYEISIRKVSFETGIKEVDIKKHLVDFEKEGKIKYSSNRVLLLNFLKHQNYNFNMMKSAIRTYNTLPSELKVMEINNLEETKEGFKTLCEGFGGVRKIEVEVEVEVEKEIEEEIKQPKQKTYVFNFRKSLLDLGVNKDLAEDFMKVRAKLKATNTKTALNGFVNQVNKTKYSLNQVIEVCIIKNWKSFNSSWDISGSVTEDSKPINNNEKIIRFNSNVNPTPLCLPESEFKKLQSKMKDGGYIYKILN